METKVATNPTKGEKKPKNRLLTLTINAHKLYPLTSTVRNVDAYTSLSDDENHKSGFGASKKNYETIVFKAYKVTWDIKLEDKNGPDKNYDVELVSISHNPIPPSPCYFDHSPLLPGSNEKTIIGTIAKKPLLPDKYTINFKIVFEEQPPHYYSLDPKLKANP